MKDAAHLTKLLRHADPAFFRSVLTTQYEVELPKINSTLGKQLIRKSFAEAMTFLSFSRRRELDEWAERINLLADTAGREAVESVRLGDLSDEQREAYGQLNNQYDRSLWLSAYAEDIFRETIDARDANVLRQSTLCYSGFEGPARLALKEDKASLSFFHHKVAEWLACPREDIAIEVFKRFSPDSETDEDVALYQVSIHYNLAPETVECVKKSQLDSAEVTRAVSNYITYEPSSGQINVCPGIKLAARPGHAWWPICC